MRCCAALILALLACPGPAHGWGREGHRIVAAIAEGHLTPKTRAALRELIGEADLGEESLWPDQVTRRPAYAWSRPLHYVNVPRDAEEVDLARDCADEKCVVQAIATYRKVLEDKKQTSEQRRIALRFLSHFVGDIHQPLHVSYADDRGGNDVKVAFFGEPWKLHAVWDSAILERRTEGNWAAHAKGLAARIEKKQLKEWRASLDPVAWANESLVIVPKRVYRFPADGKVDEKYHEENLPVVERRLSMAGVRLAAVLNGVFDAPDGAKSKN